MKYHAILIFILLAFGCASYNRIGSDIIPAESFTTQIVNTRCASVISNNFSIALEELKPYQLEGILKNRTFNDKDSKYNLLRMPKLSYFKLLFENTGRAPHEIAEIRLQYNNYFSGQLNADELYKRYANSPFSSLNFTEIFKIFKIDTYELCDTEVDLKNSLENYHGSILPGDKIFKIIAFDWIPVDIRKFNISILVKSDIIKKIIDFKMMRSEYRQSGDHFSKPATDENAY